MDFHHGFQPTSMYVENWMATGVCIVFSVPALVLMPLLIIILGNKNTFFTHVLAYNLLTGKLYNQLSPAWPLIQSTAGQSNLLQAFAPWENDDKKWYTGILLNHNSCVIQSSLIFASFSWKPTLIQIPSRVLLKEYINGAFRQYCHLWCQLLDSASSKLGWLYSLDS